MFNLHKASFIPQANVQNKEPELADLVLVKEEKKIEWDLMFTPATNRWKIKPSFYENQQENQGFTAALQDGYLFILQTDDNQVKEIIPRFLKGKNPSGIFTSNYFNLLAVQAGFSITEKCYLFLTEQETGIENVKVYLVTKEIPDVVLPEKESVEEPPISSVISTKEALAKDWEGTPDNTNLF